MLATKFTDCQNIVCCAGTIWNKACTLRLSRYILLLFACLPICHSIRITVKAAHNHNSPAV